jgi:hypothetical protein
MARTTPIERMHERIPDSGHQQLQYFISESDWDAQGVIMEVAQRTQASLLGQAGGIGRRAAGLRAGRYTRDEGVPGQPGFPGRGR